MKNNCSNKRNYLYVFFVLLLFLFPPINNIHASYKSTWLTPSSGKITTAGTNINIAVDSGNDNFVGVDITIEYTGQVEYVNGAINANSGCGFLDIANSPSTGTNGGGRIAVMCAYTGDEKKYNGIVVTLKFKAKATSGESKFKITRAATATHGASLVGGSYTLAASTTGGGNGNSNSNSSSDTVTGGMGGSDLPQSGIFDNVSQKVLIGSSLVMASVLLAISPIFLPKLSLLVKNTHNLVSNTITAVFTKQKENSEKRRRGKLEKNF